MPRVGFEPTIPAMEGPKTVHALDRAATVIGLCLRDIIYVIYIAEDIEKLAAVVKRWRNIFHSF
jgi:hypothetical protein